MTTTHYRLRLPGPTTVPERVRLAIARPVVSHRGPEFRAVFTRAEELLQPLLGTRNRILFFASTGTGMMEASLVNLLAPGERILVSANGQFGERFAAIGRAMGACVDTVDTPWGHTVDLAEIQRRLNQVEYRLLVVVHNESSTGVVTDLAALGALLRDKPTLLVADSVSGLGGIEMRQDEWGVDVVVSSSQKALMCPPGLGIASISPKAWDVAQRDDRMPRYYWDFRKALQALEEPGTPFTTAVALMTGLREALEMIHEEGIPQVLNRHRQVASALTAGCAALGLHCFPQADRLSHTVVCLRVPEGLKGGDIVRGMYQRHGTVIAGSRNQLEGKVIRIGTMGHIFPGDILTDLLHLEDTLETLGFPVSPGAGVTAAAREFSDAR